MSFSLKAASLAVVSLATVAAIGGPGVAPAFGAAGIEVQPSLLPESIVAAASAEAQDADRFTIIDEAPLDEAKIEEAEQAEAASLAELVSRHARTETISREQECLAAATYFEAKSESLEGQLAVAQVVLNRAQSGRFASSTCGVVFQRGQFSFVRGNGFPPIARGGRDWREAVAIAHIAQNKLWDSSVSNALFFHAKHVSPRWRLARVGSVGNHVFYR